MSNEFNIAQVELKEPICVECNKSMQHDRETESEIVFVCTKCLREVDITVTFHGNLDDSNAGLKYEYDPSPQGRGRIRVDVKAKKPRTKVSDNS